MSGQKKELADLRIRSTILQFNSSSLCKLFLFFFFSFFRGLAGRNEYTGLTRGSRVNSVLPVFAKNREKKRILHFELELNIPSTLKVGGKFLS